MHIWRYHFGMEERHFQYKYRKGVFAVKVLSVSQETVMAKTME